MRSSSPISSESRTASPSPAIFAPLGSSRRNEPPDRGELPKRLVERCRWKSGPALAGGNVMHQAGPGGKLGACAERHMIGYAGAAAELHAVAEGHGARQPD